MKPIFITGIGTDVGKTLVSAIVVNALRADYWKPIQAGTEDGTDSQTIERLLSQTQTTIHPEVYRLRLPASPHIAARQENVHIDLSAIRASMPQTDRPLVIEGAGGLLVPVNETAFIIDIIKELDAAVILVSRNYLGSINHSLLTSQICRQQGLEVLGWIFTDQFLDYQEEISEWSGYPVLGSIPWLHSVDQDTVREQADRLEPTLKRKIESKQV